MAAARAPRRRSFRGAPRVERRRAVADHACATRSSSAWNSLRTGSSVRAYAAQSMRRRSSPGSATRGARRTRWRRRGRSRCARRRARSARARAGGAAAPRARARTPPRAGAQPPSRPVVAWIAASADRLRRIDGAKRPRGLGPPAAPPQIRAPRAAGPGRESAPRSVGRRYPRAARMRTVVALAAALSVALASAVALAHPPGVDDEGTPDPVTRTTRARRARRAAARPRHRRHPRRASRRAPRHAAVAADAAPVLRGRAHPGWLRGSRWAARARRCSSAASCVFATAHLISAVSAVA